ncbi:MAG: DUF1566 domain-containing protein [Gammaproteobacteria bacterium]
MQTLTAELRSTIVRRIESAPRHELASIVSALCAHDDVAELVQTVRPAAAGERFERRGAGTLLDTTSGLEWTRQNVPGDSMNWEAAKEASAKLELDGGNWRLPTIKELLTLVDYERHDPAIDPAFECKPNWYWTATPYAPSPGVYAWGVSFSYGNAYYFNRGNYGFVRAVRGGQ